MRKLRKTKKAQYFYHVTPKNLGEKYVFKPQKIRGADYREPDIKRTCVADSIAKCFSAINIVSCDYNVYRTVKPVRAYITYNVFDVGVTREKWLLSPVPFVKIANIPVNIATQLPCSSRGDESYLFKQKDDLKRIK